MNELNKIEIDEERNDSDECCFWVDEDEFKDLFNEVLVSYKFNNNVFEG